MALMNYVARSCLSPYPTRNVTATTCASPSKTCVSFTNTCRLKKTKQKKRKKKRATAFCFCSANSKHYTNSLGNEKKTKKYIYHVKNYRSDGWKRTTNNINNNFFFPFENRNANATEHNWIIIIRVVRNTRSDNIRVRDERDFFKRAVIRVAFDKQTDTHVFRDRVLPDNDAAQLPRTESSLRYVFVRLEDVTTCSD